MEGTEWKQAIEIYRLNKDKGELKIEFNLQEWPLKTTSLAAPSVLWKYAGICHLGMIIC